jgi:hypothetical protein
MLSGNDCTSRQPHGALRSSYHLHLPDQARRLINRPKEGLLVRINTRHLRLGLYSTFYCRSSSVFPFCTIRAIAIMQCTSNGGLGHLLPARHGQSASTSHNKGHRDLKLYLRYHRSSANPISHASTPAYRKTTPAPR